jgi:PAS domain S-box-containing protein
MEQKYIHEMADRANGNSGAAASQAYGARLTSIVETTIDGIMTVDEQGYIDTFNRAAERLFGYGAEEVLGKHVSMLIPPAGQRRDGDFLASDAPARGKEAFRTRQEVLGVRKDGSTFPVQLFIGEMRLGDHIFFTEIVHDISEAKRAEERALQAERLATIGQMLSAVTHESRNLMQRMAAYSEMAALECQEQGKALEYISRIKTAQEELYRLFEELRNFAAPMTLRLQPCCLDHLVDKVLSEVSTVNKDREIQLLHRVDGCDAWCEVDPFRISQVFRNLIENSVAAGPDPLRIELDVSDANFQGRPAVQLVYRDNGPGLDTEQRCRIFEPFFTTRAQGTGLGMSIAKRIVESHRGQMAVGDHASPGAEFVITLPRLSVEWSPMYSGHRHFATAFGLDEEN